MLQNMTDDLDIPEFLRRKPGQKSAARKDTCPYWPSCGCGTQSGPHTCEWREKTRSKSPSLKPINPPRPEPAKERAAPSYNHWQMAELEGMLDDESDEFYEWMVAKEVGRLTLSHFVKSVTPRLDDLDKNTKIIYQNAIDAANSILENKRRTRKPRKLKRASVEKVIKNVKYTEVEPASRIASIPPGMIIGKTVLWAFDCKTRMLKLYRAKEGVGFTFDRSSVGNVDEELCLQKKVRKPEVILPKVVNEAKATVLGLFKGIKAVESKLPTMRTNSSFVFLRVF